ncbi:MAG: hypothetical protein F4Z14_00540 [Gammaproteobacteria bacterium]|nr:hypothetical protein [Gammaproteobacteria bacterium]
MGLALLTGYIAERKGRDPIKWAIFGFFVPVVALLIVAIVDDYVPPRERYGPPYRPPYDPTYREPQGERHGLIVPAEGERYEFDSADPPAAPPHSEDGRAS